ncbi:AAA family ATPase [Ligilactobacillus ruminis]|uniref:AAA family ATPase n=1 Tax=Ligilactobacillus ruminis TaxID=1623 RepID=UPI003F99C01B
MRYYTFALYASADQIKEKTTINLREYAYENTIAAVNNYMYKRLDNDVCFFAYREEGNTTYAVFSYDEKKGAFIDAFSHITGVLKEDFSVNRIKTVPCEITMYQALDFLLEAKRRDFMNLTNRFVDTSNLWTYNYYNSETKSFHFDFKEKIVPEKSSCKNTIYDQAFIDELINIEEHENASDFKGNMVHYVVCGHSIEAVKDMTETLMQSLIRAKRISSRRMEVISEIEPDVYLVQNHLNDIIEGNYGGVVVLDLTEKFGCDPVDYTLTSKYIVNLLKEYRNKCLFVFTYNMDNPGFSYQILPQINKYVIPVMLREGRGDRRAAIRYMKALIKDSAYAEYVGQAGEFMKLFPGNEFTQTDVLMAYEQFESWCLNKNVLHDYNYDMSQEFMLDRDGSTDSSYDKLNKLIGLDIVKKQIESIIALDLVEKERIKHKGKDYQACSMNMIFGGNPGSAKTTVAKLFAGIAKEKGILKSGAFVERGGMDLDGLGCVTAIREAFLAAKGGVLFIDEAYFMVSDTAVTVLIQEMENRREDVIVILAGYNDRIRDFMKINEGLKSRIPHWGDFPDYTADELTDIFKLMIEERGFQVTDEATKETHYIFEKVRNTDNFGNGRYVRNLIDRASQNQAVRLLSDGKDASVIKKKELFQITKDDISLLEEGLKNEREPGTAKKELDNMIGLASVKKIIHKAIAHYKLNKLCIAKGIAREKASLHMVFTGNPGTAKTSVARLFAEILKDEKVLSTGTFVEVGRADLVGDHVGATAPLVKRKFKEAQGGILFIDEAYSLCDSYENGFGDEAINTIVQEMENHRDNIIVIFAGYKEPMQRFLDRNPGMLSRIAFQIEFDDYTTEELCDIAKLMASKKQMTITDAAMDKLRENFDIVREESDYGNGRFVRKTLEEAEMNLAERVLQYKESEITKELITTIEVRDISDMATRKRAVKRIGFAS